MCRHNSLAILLQAFTKSRDPGSRFLPFVSLKQKYRCASDNGTYAKQFAYYKTHTMNSWCVFCAVVPLTCNGWNQIEEELAQLQRILEEYHEPK